ncbi:histidine kinase [Mycolicibacterium mucogenicum]|uniref:sensor histidine kinase n=1 Tax=Mycolicibacterium mucogenicum TaxID=56689 RepID=UPI00226A20BE|nr:ATP-binding protein [Mycolicibacterium mucogenicum]MCX8563018.1 histidine kinase [Mycolicibacterium mucogenicum]
MTTTSSPAAGIPPAEPLRDRLLALLLRPTSPPLIWGVVTAIGLIGVETLIIYELKQVAPDTAFGAVFLLGVLVVSAGWGFGLAVSTSAASAMAYVWLHVNEGDGSLVPAVVVFLTLALLANVLVGQARLRAAEAMQRRKEADLAAELARLMLRTADLDTALEAAGRRVAEVMGTSFAELTLAMTNSDSHRVAIPLQDGDAFVGTLRVPADLPESVMHRLLRFVPSLQALLAAARDREQISAELQRSHAQARALAGQQAALRRVATLVARGAAAEGVYSAAVTELARGLQVEHVNLLRFAGDGCVAVAAHDVDIARQLQVGRFVALDGDTLAGEIRRTGRPFRINDYRSAAGSTASMLCQGGLRCGVGAPITVAGAVWGAMVVDCVDEQPLPPGTEDRVADFADLVGTAIANADTRAELQASRARIVTAADQARRGFERDLHDGAQQRIVSLGLELRALEASVRGELPEIGDQLDKIVDGLAELHTDLRELSRGIHPAILSRGGVGPAIKALSRRSSIPVDLDLDVDRRLPEPVEVAAYYVVSEALTNAAKHAQASEVTVWTRLSETALNLRITDNGVGGAGPGGGSGLIGLKDRVEALSGRLDILSEPGSGTTISVTIPLSPGAN